MNRSSTTSMGFLVAVMALFSSCLLDLVLCPHSKVEESFPLQATHDIFYHGIGPAIQATFYGDGNTTMGLPYDHLQYPGVVPRTFTGPIILAYMCRILLLPFSILQISVNPMTVQFLARFCLLLFNLMGWIQLAKAVDRKTFAGTQQSASFKPTPTTGALLLWITACQFHIPFYASRMLPNTFALAVVLRCYAYWIDGNVPYAAALLVFATVVFRCDLLLLLGSIGLSWLLSRQITIVQALRIGIVTGIAALLLTVPIDTILWQRPVWPEGEVFYFNTILGKSNEWGTSPWYWYFALALPKAMLLTLLLVPLSIFRIAEILVAWEHGMQTRKVKRDGVWKLLSQSNVVDTTWLPFLLPIVGFVAFYSFLGHKEMRFIFPALPILNVGAAVGMSRIHRLAFPADSKKRREVSATTSSFSRIAFLGYLCGLGCIVLTLAGSLMFVAVSRQNYPGGDALAALVYHIKQLDNRPASVKVHIDVASAMSGVSLFGQLAAKQSTSLTTAWEFFKGGYEEAQSVNDWSQFTHLLTEDPVAMATLGFHVVLAIPGHPSLNQQEQRIDTENVIFVMERNERLETDCEY